MLAFGHSPMTQGSPESTRPMDHATTAATASNALVATGITIWGVATGLSYEVLLAGFAGGLVSLSFLGPMPAWRRIWTPFMATITAGYVSPVGAHYLNKAVSGEVNSLSLLVASAFFTGLLMQWAIPLVIKWANRKADTYEGPAV